MSLTVKNIKIFPCIGIARLGNSPPDWPDDRKDKGKYFIGPEIPGDHSPPSEGYKDSSFRIKRQAARFHLFGYEDGSDIGKEITLADADIKWTVKLANTKAASNEFYSVENHKQIPRNAHVQGRDRDSLCIMPGSRTLDSTKPTKKGFKRPTQVFDTGTFPGKKEPIMLGEMQTEPDGHLLVLGGFGISESPSGQPIKDFANNDGWYDDVSDGPVNACVRMKGTDTWINALPAWVICAPPKFVPAIEDMVTLYDTLLQVAVDKENRGEIQGAKKLLPADTPSFTNDVYPLLARAMNMKWVSSLTGVTDTMHPTIQNAMPLPGPDTPEQRDVRNEVFRHLRSPTTKPHIRFGVQNMPWIWSDVVDRDNRVTESLKPIQYKVLQQWRDGKFDNDWGNPQTKKTKITPEEALNRAALENCVGAPLYPGIETSYNTRDSYHFIEPFRLDASQLTPGDLTKQMAVPWQADFIECAFDDPFLWWPAHRPDEVVLVDSVDDRPNFSWIRDEDHIRTAEDFIKNWNKLGFVVRQGDRYVETERIS